MVSTTHLPGRSRVELFRLLGDEDRLRLLALAAAEELTVGELAQLVGESQPQITKKTQPLRDAGLLVARREGTRTLLRAEVDAKDPIQAAALAEGHALAQADGSLAKIPALVRQREDRARRLFAEPSPPEAQVVVHGLELVSLLSLFRPLVPARALAIDVGAGEGALLPLLAPVFDRVIALDRSPARLARSAARASALGLANVRTLEGEPADPHVVEELERKGGADLVLVARVLRYAARPKDTVAAAARLARPGGHVAIVEALPHADEGAREQGVVWLGFTESRLRELLEGAHLRVVAQTPLPLLGAVSPEPHLQLAVGAKPNE